MLKAELAKLSPEDAASAENPDISLPQIEERSDWERSTKAQQLVVSVPREETK